MATIGLILLALCCLALGGVAVKMRADGFAQWTSKVLCCLVGIGWGAHIILSVAGVIK